MKDLWNFDQAFKEYLKPGMSHDFWYGDALVRVSGQRALEEVPALWRDMVRLLKVRGNNAREHLLEPDQIVAPVIPPLCKRKDACKAEKPDLTLLCNSASPLITLLHLVYNF